MRAVVREFCNIPGWSAVVRVPVIPTFGPRQFVAKRCHEVVDAPGQNSVVVHRHVEVYHADSVANACK